MTACLHGGCSKGRNCQRCERRGGKGGGRGGTKKVHPGGLHPASAHYNDKGLPRSVPSEGEKRLSMLGVLRSLLCSGGAGRSRPSKGEGRRLPWNGAAPSLLYSEGESERRGRRRGRVLLFSWSPGSEGNTPRLLSNSPLSKKRLALTGERKGRRRRRPTAVSWWQKKCCVPIPRTLKSSFFAWPLHKPTAKQTFSGRETSAGGGEERRDRREVSWTNEHRRGRRRRRRSKAEEEETEEEARRRGERNRLLISPSTEEEEVKNR